MEAKNIRPGDLYNTLKVILHACKNTQYAWPFMGPVDRKVVPDYYDTSSFRWT